MSKNKNRNKENNNMVSSLSALSSVIDVDTLPVVQPEETGDPQPETEETKQSDPEDDPAYKEQDPSYEDPEILDAATNHGQVEILIADDDQIDVALQEAGELDVPLVEHIPDEPALIESPDEPVDAAVEIGIQSAESVSEASAAFESAAPPDPAPVEPPNPPITSEAMKLIEDLRAQINALSTAKTSRKIASGSKPRANVVYTLLSKPPAWHSTPQVAQLQQILFDPKFVEAHRHEDGTISVTEPELFAQVEAGASAGILRTKQLPVRIFQYYRSDLLNSNCLRWQ